MASRSGARFTDAEWLQQKPSIRRMLIDQNMSQLEIRRRLEDDGFLVTKAQLEYKLKVWGFRKRAPRSKSDAVWQFIGHRIEKRKQQAKASEVYLNGEKLESSKVTKEINRHQPTSLARIAEPMSPRTPEGLDIVVRTPSPRSEAVFSVLSNLPWTKFEPMFSIELLRPYTPITYEDEAAGNLLNQGLLLLDESLDFRSDDSQTDIYRLATELSSIMPEAREFQNLERARILLHGPAHERIIEYFKVIFYRLSNKLTQSSTLTSKLHWAKIIDIFGRMNITQQVFPLNERVSPTLLAIAECLFQHSFGVLASNDLDQSLATKATKMITWLLSSGQSPDTLIRDPRWGLVTPLQHAAVYKMTQLAIQLLEAGADPDLTSKSIRATPLITLLEEYDDFDKKSIELIWRLLKTGAALNEDLNTGQSSALVLAVGHSNLQLIDTMIQNGADISFCGPPARGSGLACFIERQSVLGYAASLEEEAEAMKCLSHLLECVEDLQLSHAGTDFITADVLISAASQGHENLLIFLHDLGCNIVAKGANGVSALHAAAYHGHSTTCELLLRLGAGVNEHENSSGAPTPLHLAAYKNHIQVVELLVSSGADVNHWVDLKEGSTKWDTLFRHGSACSQLESHITHLSQFYRSPVGAALLGGNYEVYKILVSLGATTPDWAVFLGACSPKNAALVEDALSAGADVNWHGDDGCSVLRAALTPQHPDDPKEREECARLASFLLDAGAIPAEGEAGLAIALENWDLAERIFGFSNGHIEQLPFPMSLLETALLTGSLNITNEILNRQPDAYSAGALCAGTSLAVANQDFVVVVRKLLENRPPSDANYLEGLAIGLAAWHGQPLVLDMLLKSLGTPALATLPSQVNQVHLWSIGTAEGILMHLGELFANSARHEKPFWHQDDAIIGSPLILALWSEDSLSQLLHHGYRPDRLTMSVAAKMNTLRPLHQLLSYQRLVSTDENSRIQGPLSVLTARNHCNGVKLVLSYGEDPNEDNRFVEHGRSPLQVAVECGYLDLIELLLSAGADVNAPAADNRGATALQLAATKGFLGVVKRLVDLGADVNAPGAKKGGRTALEAGAEQGRIDTIQYLLSSGTQVDAKGRLSYLRAIRYAELEGHMVAAKLLKTWREWTSGDDALWDKLQCLPKDECERFTEKDFEDQSDSNSESERHSPRKANTGDGMQDPVFYDAPAAEAHTRESSCIANPACEIIEDLETMTNDAFTFWSEV